MIVDVVLVRAKSSIPSAISELAAAISERYGVPAEAVEAKLLHGSFRVKSRTDIETAHRYQRHLDAMGAVCEIRDCTTGRVVAQPAQLMATVSDHLASPSANALAAHELDPSLAGLAAADGVFSADLGALNTGKLSLATLDDRSSDRSSAQSGDHANVQAPLETPTHHLDPLIDLDGPVPDDLGRVGNAEQVDQRFAPPSDTSNPEVLTLALEPDLDGPPIAEPSATMAPIASSPLASSPLPRPPVDVHQQSFAVSEEQPKPDFGARVGPMIAAAKSGLASRSRGAFVTGVAIAMLAGFLIAHVIGVIQENNAYPPARKELLVSYAEATEASSHAGLASIRESTLNLIHSRQTKIATTSLLIWVVVSAAAGFVWFRLIDWERLRTTVSPTMPSSEFPPSA